MGAHLPGQAVLLTRRADAQPDRANGACYSLRDGSHPLIDPIRYLRRVIYRGLGGRFEASSAPERCLMPFPAVALVFESDLLIYPARVFWRRFGSLAFVGEKMFSAKFICMGEGGGRSRF